MTSPRVDRLLLQIVEGTKTGNKQMVSEAKAVIEHGLMTKSLKRRVLNRRMIALRVRMDEMKAEVNAETA